MMLLMLRVVLIFKNSILTLSSIWRQWLLLRGDNLKGLESFKDARVKAFAASFPLDVQFLKWSKEKVFVQVVEKVQSIAVSSKSQKQPSRCVPRKRCSENMQQIYRRTPMPKCDFNKVAKQLYWNCTSAWVFSCKFAAYFQNTFSKNISGWLLLKSNDSKLLPVSCWKSCRNWLWKLLNFITKGSISFTKIKK